MIPEFFTAKPATNRNAADAPPVPDTNSANQSQNKAAFQKALHERTSERPADQQAASADDVRPEESRQSSPPGRTSEDGRQIVSRETPSQKRPETAENQQLRKGLESAQSTATDVSPADENRELEVRSQEPDTEASTGNRETSQPIRRIDPANHSNLNDTATRPSENAVESGEVSKPPSETLLPRFISTDDADIGTLPSLIRFPLDDVTVSQLSVDFVSPDATPDGERIDVPVQSSPTSGQNVPASDSELRPFLNDALIPDTESVATDPQFSATEPSLIAGDLLNSPAADNVIPSDAGEELSAIPTLPSLRPEATLTVSTLLPVETDSKGSGAPVIENVAGDVVVDGILRSVERSSGATLTDVEPSPQLPNDGAVAVEDSPSAELPLVLPSLVSGPKRPPEAATDTVDHNSSGEQTSNRKAFAQSSPAAAAPAVSESSLQVPVPPQVEAVPLAQQKVVAEKPQVVDTAFTLSVDGTTDRSKSSAPQNPAVVSTVEPSVSQPANEASRRATESSDSSTIVEKKAAPSSGNIDSEQSVPRRAVAERTAAERNVPTVSARVGSSQPTEVEAASAATPPEEAVDVPNRTREAIVSVESNAKSNIAPQTAQRVSSSEDRQTVQKVASSAAAVNSVVADSVQIEASDDRASERASIPVAEVIETDSRKRSIDSASNQKSADSTDSPPSNSEWPAGSGRSVVETPPQTTHQNFGARSQEGVPIIASGDEPAAGAQAGPAATTTVERAAVEPRASNDSDTSSVRNDGVASVSQTGQSVSPVAVQSGPAIDAPTGAVGASPSSINEVGNVSSPAAPVEVPTSDATAVSNVQAAATSTTAASSNAATSNAATLPDAVREPAVPMEIQDAVSAIQEATSGDSHIRVRLNPRELGNMLVDVSRTENGVVARLEVESAAARVAVLETLPDLQQSLSRSGSTVDRVEVVLTETRAESGRQEGDQSQPGDQQSRQERQSSDQQARDEQNRRREQNQQRDQREDSSSVEEDSTDHETLEQLDIKL